MQNNIKLYKIKHQLLYYLNM